MLPAPPSVKDNLVRFLAQHQSDVSSLREMPNPPAIVAVTRFGSPSRERATMKANVGTYVTMPTFSKIVAERTGPTAAMELFDLQNAGIYRYCAVSIVVAAMTLTR